MASAPPDLRAPLLSPPEVVVDVAGRQPDLNGFLGGGTLSEDDSNPFEFVGADPLDLPPPSSIDPFRNSTPTFGGACELLKMVICLPIALLRLALFGVAIAFGFLATLLALKGWTDKQNPMPRWRSRVMWVTRFCSRCILFSFGYHWIKRIGKPALREDAPIVVSNHISFIEPIFFFYELFPTIVASESHDAIPFVGTIIRAMQVIYVDRFNPSSRKLAVNEIKRKALSNRFPRVLLFPEGTTTNGRVLLSFQVGAFLPGLAIQPVVVRYPHIHFDQSWGNISLAQLMFRMFLQFHNFIEVEYLPVVRPLESKHETVVQLSNRTSYAMANALNVVQTPHSFGDMILLMRAKELNKEKATAYLVEMGLANSFFNIGATEAVEFLNLFFSMNPDSSGRVEIHGFLEAFGLEQNLATLKIFGYFDADKKGSITFRQFLLGSGYIRKQPLFIESCEDAFNKLDNDNQGFVSREQLSDFARSIMPSMGDERLDGFLHLFDIDNNGSISREDFMMCLQKNPLLIALFALG